MCSVAIIVFLYLHMIDRFLLAGVFLLCNYLLHAQGMQSAGEQKTYLQLATNQTASTSVIQDPDPSTSNIEVRGEPFILSVANQFLKLDKVYTIDFYLQKPEDVESIQFTLEANQHAVEIIKVIPGLQLDFKPGNYDLFQDLNSISVNWQKDDQQVDKGESIIFSLMIRVSQPIHIDQAFVISSRINKAKGINNKGEEVNINLNIQNNGLGQSSFFEGFGPNPVQHNLYFSCYATDGMTVSFLLIDQYGRQHRKLMDRYFEKGNNTVEIDVSDFANGVYYLLATVNQQTQSVRKLMIHR